MDKETGTSEDNSRLSKALDDIIMDISRYLSNGGCADYTTLKFIIDLRQTCLIALCPKKKFSWMNNGDSMLTIMSKEDWDKGLSLQKNIGWGLIPREIILGETEGGCTRSSNGDDAEADQPITVSSSGIRETPL